MRSSMTDSARTTNTSSPHRVASTLRLFVALWPSTKARAAAVTVQRGIDWPAGARLCDAEGLHVTLAFLGSVPVDNLAGVSRAAAVPSANIVMMLDQLQVWKGGIAVLRPSIVPATLVALHARLTESLWTAGVPFDERPFTPHLTLARKADGITREAVPAMQWRSSGHVLVQTAGGRYVVVGRSA